MGCRKIKETHCGRRRSSIKTDRQGNSIPPPVWYLIYYNIKANDNGRKLNFNTAPAAASIVRTYPVRPQRWRQCRRTALHAPCNKNILHAFCRFAGAAPHSGPGPVTDTKLPSLTTPVIMRSTGVSEKTVLPQRKNPAFLCVQIPPNRTLSAIIPPLPYKTEWTKPPNPA